MDFSEQDVLAKIIETRNLYFSQISWTAVKRMKLGVKERFIQFQRHKSEVDMELHRLNILRRYLPESASSCKSKAHRGRPKQYSELYMMASKLDLVSKRKSWTRHVY